MLLYDYENSDKNNCCTKCPHYCYRDGKCMNSSDEKENRPHHNPHVEYLLNQLEKAHKVSMKKFFESFKRTELSGEKNSDD